MRSLLLTLLAFAAGCTGCASTSQYERSQPAAVRLEWPQEQVCSGTAIGPHTLISAAHCFGDKTGWLLVNDVRADYTVIADDSNDHVLVRVSIRMAHVATLGPKPKQGDVVFTHGNPGGFADLLIVGRVAGWVKGQMVVDSNNWHGDSGAGVLDTQGRIVGVVDQQFPWPPSCNGATCWKLTQVNALKFSAEDWRSATNS
jgi:hypothetical protein